MSDPTQSSQIYLSRDQVRTQIISYIKDYLELDNIDLTKSSFLSYIINTLSTLTSNLLFYETSVYREFFLTQAQLPESILNLSAFLGYNSTEALYATADVLMTIPFGFEDSPATFTIPEGFKFNTTTCQFVTYYTTTITVTGNATVSVVISYENKVYELPVDIDTTSANEFSFILPTRQYKITTQQFQIDSDLELYQFSEIDVPISGKVSSLNVVVTPPDGAYPITYTEFNSLYLMSSTDYGYVSVRTINGRKIYFGNGLIGKQPDPGSTVDIEIYETLGVDGNVIAGAINNGDRIYITTLSGQTKLVDYTCVNTLPGTGGDDEESTDDIRINSIKNLVSMDRFVSETDYENANVILDDSPFGDNSLAVLKRSDVKVNEIQLYTTLEYDDEIVPTRNLYAYTLPSTVYIPKYTTILKDSTFYYTLFDMTLDYINSSATYDYILNDITITPTLNITYSDTYNLIHPTTLEVFEDSNNVTFNFKYTGEDSSCTCVMEILETDNTYSMINDSTNNYFYVTFSPYTTFPEGEVTIYLTYSSPGYGQIAKYTTKVRVREGLDECMMSNLVSDGTVVTIYDIPTVESTYYDSLTDKADFELNCIQSTISVSDFRSHRMLTDFINLKFANTTGTMTNMKYNKVNKETVIDIADSPTYAVVTGQRYIVGQNPTGVFLGHRNEYAQCTDSTSSTWTFTQSYTNDIVNVTDKGERYIFTGTEWIVPEYTIPLQIELEVFKSSSYFYSDTELINNIKSAIIEEFENRFGINAEIYRSEIIAVVQEVTGVQYCNLIHPTSDLFFNFDLDDMTQDELMMYSPEYVYFTEDDIVITII